jgi:hypothetical protein
MKVGACLFDDLKFAGNAWCSVAGDKPYRVNSFSELRADVLWVTNLDYNVYRKLNLTKMPNIFDGQYFRTSIRAIASEAGLSESPKEASQFISKILNRVYILGEKYFKETLLEPGYRYMTTLAARCTPEVIRKKVTSQYWFEITDAIRQSTQSNQALVGEGIPSGAKAYIFNIPRAAHAQWLLSQKYPSGEKWQVIKSMDNEATFGFEDGTLIKGTKAVIQKLATHSEKNGAMFLRVNIHSIDPGHRSFATFGAGSQYPRRWATLPEIIDMARYCKLSIQGGYATGWTELPFSNVMNNDFEFSYSKGLFLENLWCGISGAINDRHSAVGAYMRAYDRIICGRYAEIIAGYNFKIGSFGTGKIVVYLRPGDFDFASELCVKHGLNPPIQIIGR